MGEFLRRPGAEVLDVTPRHVRRNDDRDRPLRLLRPRLVPLSAEHESRAVDALAGMLAGLLERHRAAWSDTDTGHRGHADVPDDDEAA